MTETQTEELKARVKFLTAPIEVIRGFMQGYGSSDVYSTKLVWNNKELEFIQSSSDYDVGFRTAEALAHWSRLQKRGNLEKHALKKKQAFQLCDICKGEMRNSTISQYDFHVCSEACRERGEHKYHMMHGVTECKEHFSRSVRMNHFSPTMECYDCGLMWAQTPEGKAIAERYYK
jgi:hypothetical protein